MLPFYSYPLPLALQLATTDLFSVTAVLSETQAL